MNIAYLIKSLFLSPRKFAENVLRFPPIAQLIPDKLAISMFYRLRFHRSIDLKHPQTFNEKLLWLTLYDRRPEYVRMVDNVEAKKWIADKLVAEGKSTQCIIPTYGVYNHFDDIDFEKMPNSFVIKTTHDSGGVVVVNDKATFDRAKAKSKLEKSLQRNYFWFSREWAYRDVPPRIIIEKKVESKETIPADYKIYCLNGKAQFALVVQGRYSQVVEDFYDRNFQPLDFHWGGHSHATQAKEKPKCWREMLDVAETLSYGYPMIRVDFFVDKNSQFFVGELTLTPASGLQGFDPEEWDYKFGAMLELPYKGEKHDN